MTRDKRYTERQAIRLLARLTAIQNMSIARTRRLLTELLAAHLGDVVVKAGAETVRRARATDIAGLRRGVYSFLELALVDDRDPVARRWPDLVLRNVTLTIAGPANIRVRAEGALSTLLTLQVYSLLSRVGEHLRRCACGRMYVRVRRQQYCSARCQKRYYMRRFRAGDTE